MRKPVPDSRSISTGISVCMITLFLFLSLPMISQVFEGGDVSAEETIWGDYTIITTVVWNDTTIYANSIEVKSTGTLIVENTDIVMNASSSNSNILNNGRLYMNDSWLGPKPSSSDNYDFRSNGHCELNRNVIVEPLRLMFFTPTFVLRDNDIHNSYNDSVYVRGHRDANASIIISDNTIFDAGNNAFRFYGVNADLSDNEIDGAKWSAFHILDSKITITNTMIDDVEGPHVAIGGDSDVTIYPDTNVTEDDVYFIDGTSSGRIWTEDGFITLAPPVVKIQEESFIKSRFNMIILVVLVFTGIILTLVLDRWWDTKGKRKKKLHIPSVEVGKAANSIPDVEERVEKRRAGVQEEFGDMALDGGAYEAAIEYYERALTLNERRDEILVKKAGALEKMGRHVEALECYEQALDINSGNAEALLGKDRYASLITSREKESTMDEGEDEEDPLENEENSDLSPGKDPDGTSTPKKAANRSAHSLVSGKERTKPGVSPKDDPGIADASVKGAKADEGDLFGSQPSKKSTKIHGIGKLRKKFTQSETSEAVGAVEIPEGKRRIEYVREDETPTKSAGSLFGKRSPSRGRAKVDPKTSSEDVDDLFDERPEPDEGIGHGIGSDEERLPADKDADDLFGDLLDDGDDDETDDDYPVRQDPFRPGDADPFDEPPPPPEPLQPRDPEPLPPNEDVRPARDGDLFDQLIKRRDHEDRLTEPQEATPLPDTFEELVSRIEREIQPEMPDRVESQESVQTERRENDINSEINDWMNWKTKKKGGE